MAWRVEFTPEAEKQLSRIERQSAKRIIQFLRDRISPAEDPRTPGKPLKGVLREFWRYRVGDYRIMCRIENDQLLVLVIRVAHRREIYRKI